MNITQRDLLRRMEIVSESRQRAIEAGNESAVRAYDVMLATHSENLKHIVSTPNQIQPSAMVDGWEDYR